MVLLCTVKVMVAHGYVMRKASTLIDDEKADLDEELQLAKDVLEYISHNTCESCCHVLLDNEPTVLCAECPGHIRLCLKCFSQGEQPGRHHNWHCYSILPPRQLIAAAHDESDGWTTTEELTLLSSLESRGYGDWEAVSLRVGRPPEDCRRRYNSRYINCDGPFSGILQDATCRRVLQHKEPRKNIRRQKAGVQSVHRAFPFHASETCLSYLSNTAILQSPSSEESLHDQAHLSGPVSPITDDCSSSHLCKTDARQGKVLPSSSRNEHVLFHDKNLLHSIKTTEPVLENNTPSESLSDYQGSCDSRSSFENDWSYIFNDHKYCKKIQGMQLLSDHQEADIKIKITNKDLPKDEYNCFSNDREDSPVYPSPFSSEGSHFTEEQLQCSTVNQNQWNEDCTFYANNKEASEIQLTKLKAKITDESTLKSTDSKVSGDASMYMPSFWVAGSGFGGKRLPSPVNTQQKHPVCMSLQGENREESEVLLLSDLQMTKGETETKHGDINKEDTLMYVPPFLAEGAGFAGKRLPCPVKTQQKQSGKRPLPRRRRPPPASIPGYLAARSEFEVDYDNHAELVTVCLARVDWSDNDPDADLECALAVATVSAYNRRLAARRRVHKIVRDLGLVSGIVTTVAETGRLAPFAKLLSPLPAAYHLLLASLAHGGDLRRRILRLSELRSEAGLWRISQCALYYRLSKHRETFLHERRSQLQKLKTFQSMSPTIHTVARLPRGRAAATPLNVLSMPCVSQLSPSERELCSVARIPPEAYLTFRKTLEAESRKYGGSLKLAQARTLIKIDVNKTRKLYNFLIEHGVFKQA